MDILPFVALFALFAFSQALLSINIIIKESRCSQICVGLGCWYIICISPTHLPEQRSQGCVSVVLVTRWYKHTCQRYIHPRIVQTVLHRFRRVQCWLVDSRLLEGSTLLAIWNLPINRVDPMFAKPCSRCLACYLARFVFWQGTPLKSVISSERTCSSGLNSDTILFSIVCVG